MTTLAEHFRSVGESELTERVIKDLRLRRITVLSHLAATHAVALNGVHTLNPTTDVKIVDMLFANLVT